MPINSQNWLTHKATRYLIPLLLFFLSSIVYSLISLRLSVPFFVPADENLYIALAKSLFFEGDLQRNYISSNYDFLLYPLYIAQAYLFYDPARITDIMRIMGIILLSSTCVPVYFIAESIFDKRSLSFVFSLFSIIIPEMMYGFYILQETMAYPIFMWLCLIFIRSIESEGRKRHLYGFGLGCLFFLLYSIKSYFLFLIGAYFLYVVLDFFIISKRKGISRIILSSLTVLFSFLFFYLLTCNRQVAVI